MATRTIEWMHWGLVTAALILGAVFLAYALKAPSNLQVGKSTMPGKKCFENKDGSWKCYNTGIR